MWRQVGLVVMGSVVLACTDAPGAAAATTDAGDTSGPARPDDGSTNAASTSTSTSGPGAMVTGTETMPAEATGDATTETGPSPEATTTTETTGGASLAGWTELVAVDEMWPLIAPASQATELMVDPHAMDRLALRITDFLTVTGWVILDGDEVRGPELDEHTALSVGAGFDSEGRFTAAYDVGTAMRLMHSTGAAWHALTLAPSATTYDWPPRRLSVPMGAPARSLMYSDEALWQSTAWSFMPETEWSNGVLCNGCQIRRLVARPGTADELIATTAGGAILRCQPDVDILWTCLETGTAPTTELDLWVTLADPDRVIMKGSGAIYISSDAGATFDTRETPEMSFRLALSPQDPDRMIAWASGALEAVFVTDDSGQSWSPLALPETEQHSLSGVGIDGAGTIFALRGGGLFSHPGDLE